VLGIDYGTRRVGLAISDPTGTLARPLPTLTRRAGKRHPIAALAAIVEEQEAGEIVLGLPLTATGDDDEWTAQVREVGEKLAARTGLPVHFIDERFTSARAERAVRSIGLPRHEREKKGRLDAAAAVLILQAFLDGAKSGPC
jgi:putative holliday junction resolvase